MDRTKKFFTGMERIAKSVPKPCYAVEFDLGSSECQKCTFQKECFNEMGFRKHRVTLDKLEFSLVPERYGLTNIDTGDDPELPHIERTYILCHQTIFGRRPVDRIGHHKKLVIGRFREAGCSLRLFMLTNMIAYQQQQAILSEKLEQDAKLVYSASLLTQQHAVSRVAMYREMCRKAFGTFDLGSLDTLTEGGYAENDVERRMLNSEVTAARFVVGFKIRKGGPAWDSLYQAHELALDPYWLATEPTYIDNVLIPYREKEIDGTKTEKNHRYSVTQVIAQMKRKRDWGIAVHQARERIMPKAVGDVLHFHGFRETDFEMEPEVIKDTMQFWVLVGRAMQHVHCIRYLEGERSVFKR